MSPSYGVQQFFQAAAQQRQTLQEQRQRIDHESKRHQQNRDVVERGLAAARADLARSLLPGLLPELIAKAIQLTGFSPWRHQDPIRALEGERVTLQQRQRAIEAEPDFANGELLFHPRTGSITRELAEVTGHLETQRQVLHDAESHPRFAHLYQVGYGTSAYAVPFWRLSYYDDWKAADEILERFPGKSFEDVRAAWVTSRDAVFTLGEEALRLEGRLNRGRALYHEHKGIVLRLPKLSNEHLTTAQARLVEHVLTSHGPTILAALGRDPNLPNLYLRTMALTAKLRYLDGVFDEFVTKARTAIDQQLGKLARDETKYRRPKNAYAQIPADKFQKRFADRRGAYQKRWGRYDKTYVAIWGFDQWDRVPTDRDFLWWDVMTDGQVDGDYLSDVDEWHRRHGRPTYRRDRDDRDAHAVAAAAAAGQRDDDVLFGGHDAS